MGWAKDPGRQMSIMAHATEQAPWTKRVRFAQDGPSGPSPVDELSCDLFACTEGGLERGVIGDVLHYTRLQIAR